MARLIVVDERGHSATVVAFSGLAPRNHIFEWATALSGFPANFIGVRDPFDRWYQYDIAGCAARLDAAIAGANPTRVAFIGGSAGGFAALMFGRLLGADRVVSFCPQSACGSIKRALGDCRWPQFCRLTPPGDISGPHPRAVIHYAEDDDLDVMHAARIDAEHRVWPAGGHNLPRAIKSAGRLYDVLAEALSR